MSANQNEKLNPVTKSIINAQLSRRGVLAGVGAIGASVALASCGTGSSDTAAKTIEDVSDTEKIVRWASWPYYLDFDEDSKKYPTLEAFAAKFSAHIDFDASASLLVESGALLALFEVFASGCLVT